jgi:hypothetical protein
MRNRVDLIPLEEVYVYSPPEPAEAAAAQAPTEEAPSGTEPQAPEGPGKERETSE